MTTVIGRCPSCGSVNYETISLEPQMKLIQGRVRNIVQARSECNECGHQWTGRIPNPKLRNSVIA